MSLDKIRERNERAINTLAPEYQPIARDFMEKSWSSGYYFRISEVRRSRERQKELYNQGRTTPGPVVTNTMKSNHLTGLAMDIYPVDTEGRTMFANGDVTPEGNKILDSLGSMAEEFGIEWGGNWKSFVDRPHFQYRPNPNYNKDSEHISVAQESSVDDGSNIGSTASGSNSIIKTPKGSNNQITMADSLRSLESLEENPGEPSIYDDVIPVNEEESGIVLKDGMLSTPSGGVPQQENPILPPTSLPTMSEEEEQRMISDMAKIEMDLSEGVISRQDIDVSTDTPPSSIPAGLPPLPGDSGDYIDVTTNGLNANISLSAVPTVNRMDLFGLASELRDEANSISQDRTRELAVLDYIKSQYNGLKFKPMTMHEALHGNILSFSSDPGSVAESRRIALGNIDQEVARVKALKDGAFKAGWLAQVAYPVMDTYVSLTGGRGIGPGWNEVSFYGNSEEGFDPVEWMKDNRIKPDQLSSVASGKYYDKVIRSRSRAEAEYWTETARQRKGDMDKFLTMNPSTVVASSIFFDMTNPVGFPFYFTPGAVVAGARYTGLIGRHTFNRATIGSQASRILVGEGSAALGYTGTMMAMGEVRTASDALLDIAASTAMSVIIGSPGIRSGARNIANVHESYVRNIVQETMAEVRSPSGKAAIQEQAIKELGDNFTTRELVEKASEIESRTIDKHMKAILQDIPDSEKIIRNELDIYNDPRMQELTRLETERAEVIKRNEERARKREEVSAHNRLAEETDARNREQYQRDLEAYNERVRRDQSDGSEVSEEAPVDPQSTRMDEIETDEVIPQAPREGDLVDYKAPISAIRGDEINENGVRVIEYSRPGTKSKFKIEFENDIDRAAWQLRTASKYRQKSNQALVEDLRRKGINPRSLSAYGRHMNTRLNERMKSGIYKPGDTIKISDVATPEARARHLGPDGGSVRFREDGGRINPTNIQDIRSNFTPKSRQFLGGKPRYKEIELVFDNDYDEVAYRLGGENPRNRAGLVKLLEDHGLDHKAARAYGNRMRSELEVLTGGAQRGGPVDTRRLLSDDQINSILKEGEAASTTRRQRAADRRLMKKPTEPKPSPRRELSPDDMVDEVPMSIEEIRAQSGISNNFYRMPDNKTAMELTIISENLKGRKIGEVESEKVDLSRRLTKWYDKLHIEKLNPVTTKLLSSESNTARWVATYLAENPTGAIKSRSAAMHKFMLQRMFMKNTVTHYNDALNRYYSLMGKGNVIGKVINQGPKLEFDKKFMRYQTNKNRGNHDANMIEFEKQEIEILEQLGVIFDDAYDQLRVAQIDSKIKGWENLPEKRVEGYFPYRIDPDAWGSLTSSQKNSYTMILRDELKRANPELLDDEAFGLANGIVSVYDVRASTGDLISTNPYSRRGGIEIEEAIARNDAFTPEQKAAILAKYQKGQMNHTKTRHDRDINAVFYVSPDGKEMTLGDILIADPVALHVSQAGRVAGEISINTYGIQGREGLKKIREVMKGEGATNSDIEAFDQLTSELLSLPINGNSVSHQSTETIQAIIRLNTLGGLVFAQLGEMFNLATLSGVGGVFRILGNVRRLSKEAKIEASGGSAGNLILDDLGSMMGGIGTDNYRYLMPNGETGRMFNDVPYSADNLNIIGRLARTGENLQAKVTFFHSLLAAQQRGVTEEILFKSAAWMRNGKNNKALESMGIRQELIDKMKAETDSFIFNDNGQLVEFHPSRAKDAQAMLEYVQSVRRGGGQIIQETFAGERGTWVASPGWKLAMTLRQFVLNSFQKQLVRQWTDIGPWAVAGYMLGATMWSIPIQIAKANIQSMHMSEEDRKEFLADRLHPANLMFMSASYTTQGAAIMEIMNIGLSPVADRLGLQTVRSGGGGRLSSLFPVLGQAEAAFNLPGDLINLNFERAKQVTPFGNAPGISGIIQLSLSSLGESVREVRDEPEDEDILEEIGR